MKIKFLLFTVFAAGLGASYALADDGHGKGASHEAKCQEVHVNGTVAPQSVTVTLTRDSRRLNLKAGSQVTVLVGAAGQTVRFNAEACSTTSGSATQLQVKSAELRAYTPEPASTTQSTTTAP